MDGHHPTPHDQRFFQPDEGQWLTLRSQLRHHARCGSLPPNESFLAATGAPLCRPRRSLRREVDSVHAVATEAPATDTPDARKGKRTMNQTMTLVAIGFVAVVASADTATPLDRRKSIERDMSGAETHQYTMALQAGDFVRIVVDQRGVDIVVVVTAPDGSKIAEVDSPNGTNGPEPVEIVPAAEGMYRIEVRALEPKAPPGKYSVSVERHLNAAEYAASIAAEKASQDAVSRWVGSNAIPLRSADPGQGFDDMRKLKALIGRAHLVALGEATHGTREFFRFKHRMLEFLVTQMGFTVFAIEATMPESFDINEYVVTGKGDPVKALSALYFWTWNTEEVLEMIQWMRRYNADPMHTRKVRFYGFDMQAPTRALKVTFAYLQRVDPDSVAAAEAALAPLLNPFTAPNSDTMPKDWKDSTTATIAAVIKRFDERKAVYVGKSSLAEYQLARQHARLAAQNIESFAAANRTVVRDRAMAENIGWILAREGPGTKAMVWAHNGHVANRPGFMGELLRRRFGADLVTFGFVFDRGSFQAVQGGIRLGALRKFVVPPAPAGTLDSVLANSRLPLAVIDLRTLPENGQASEWLAGSRATRNVGSIYGEAAADQFFEKQNVRSYYDALVFFEETTAARPNRGGTRAAPEFLAAPSNLDFEESEAGAAPAGWSIAPSVSDFDFAISTSEDEPHSGMRCATIRRDSGRHYGETFGGLSQRLDATPWRGKRIRLRASVRSRAGATSQAHLWLMTQQQPFAPSSYAPGSEEAIGSEVWQEHERTIEVPANAQFIEYGLAMTGEGQVWVDTISVSDQ